MTFTSPLLLGHRGARRAAPENTLAAFDLALRHGCHGFEFDLRRTADGRLIVCHDPELLGLKLDQSSYQALVKKLRAHSGGSSADASDSDRLPCVEDVMDRFAGRAFLDIEFKVPGMEQAVLNVLRGCNPDLLLLSSFLPEVVERLRALDAGIPLGWICDDGRVLPAWRNLPCQVLASHCSLSGEKLIGEAHSAGRKVFVWTVNQPAEMLRFASMGTDAIISDDTELLAGTLARGAGASRD